MLEGLLSPGRYQCASPSITSLLPSRNSIGDILRVTFLSPGTPTSNSFSNPLMAKFHSLGKETQFNTHNSPRPPQAPPASFKSLYRKCSGPLFAHKPNRSCRSTSDTDLRTSGACPGFHFYEQPVLRRIGQLGRTAEAREAYRRALALTRQEPERRFIERRVQALRDKEKGEGSRR